MTNALSAQSQALPTIHVITDSVGVTAQAVARAVTSQFGVTEPRIELLTKVESFQDIEDYLERHSKLHEAHFGDNRLLIFYTVVNREIKCKLDEYVRTHENIVGVDLISPAIDAVSVFTGLEPSSKPGGLHVADQSYFNRIAALEFTIEHDDGRNPQDLAEADIVLIGVSRTSKTPLSIYLAQQGHHVANVPLDLHTDPPKELFDVSPKRLFGLMTTQEVLTNIRKRRLGDAEYVVTGYADPEYVYQDLEKARALMRRLGCIVVHTENRAVEETAQEILRYYEIAHPRIPDTMGQEL